jgi:toxin ParE1/3/4
MRVRWLRQALGNLEEIVEYIAKDNPTAAGETAARIVGKVNELAHNPDVDTSRPGRVAGTRELIITPHYIVPYRIRHGELQVLRIFHARQRWPRRFS